MGGPEMENAAPAGTGNRADYVVGKTNSSEHTDLRDFAQRRLALKLAASAGLSVAVAAVLVVVALGDGGRG